MPSAPGNHPAGTCGCRSPRSRRTMGSCSGRPGAAICSIVHQPGSVAAIAAQRGFRLGDPRQRAGRPGGRPSICGQQLLQRPCGADAHLPSMAPGCGQSVQPARIKRMASVWSVDMETLLCRSGNKTRLGAGGDGSWWSGLASVGAAALEGFDIHRASLDVGFDPFSRSASIAVIGALLVVRSRSGAVPGRGAPASPRW